MSSLQEFTSFKEGNLKSAILGFLTHHFRVLQICFFSPPASSQYKQSGSLSLYSNSHWCLLCPGYPFTPGPLPPSHLQSRGLERGLRLSKMPCAKFRISSDSRDINITEMLLKCKSVAAKGMTGETTLSSIGHIMVRLWSWYKMWT